MPSISYRDLLAGEATTEVMFNGHVISLTYDPGAITEKALGDVGRMIREGQKIARTDMARLTGEESGDIDAALAVLDEVMGVSGTVTTLLCRVLIAWDLTDDDGVTMFPITPDRLSDLPLAFRQACLNALFQAGQMGEANGTRSPAPSRATTRTATKRGSRR